MEAEIFTQDENDVRLKSLMKQMRKWLTGLSDSTDDDDGSIHRENNVRLPRIELPTFDGQYKDWKSFFDMFKGTVHDHPTLPKVQKLFYLKGALKGDAKRVLSHLPTTEANYDAAIKLLQDRCDNQFLITKAHLTNIMKIENVRKEGPDSLRKLIGTFNENEMALSALGIDTKASDFIWVHILSEKLDSETAKEWQLTNVDGKMKTMDDLRQFLERRARALEASTRSPEMKREALGSKDIDIKNKSENYQSYQSTSMICSFCKQSHRIYTRPKFLNLSIADKYEKVKQLRLCFNCLKEGHGIKTCTSKSTCQKCKRKHHSLLHREEPTSSTFSGNSLYHKQDGNVTENNNCSILLPTAIVSVLNSKNQLIPCQALLDSGSQLSFITQALSRRLNLNTTEKHLNLSGIGGQSNDVRADLTNIVLKSVSKAIRVSAYVLKQLTTSVPSKTLQLPKVLERYKLADPDFRHSQPVDMILGADVFEEIIENERKEISPGLFLRKTIFGWIVLGKHDDTVGEAFHCHLSIDDTLRRF